MDESLAVRPLHGRDAPELASLLRSQPPDYLRYFDPFGFDEETLSRVLTARVKDLYMGVYVGGRLAGFFMLRGWDEGYQVPSYGVMIGEGHARYGLGKLTLEAAKVICRLRGAPSLMLKVHPENAVAKGLYERAGFVCTGEDSRNKNLVYHLHFDAS